MGNNIDHELVELRGSNISYFTGKMEVAVIDSAPS